MGFASPSSDLTHGEYSALFEHTNGQQIELRSHFIAGPENLDPEDMDAFWTAAVALLDGNANITFLAGWKSYATTEEYSV